MLFKNLKKLFVQTDKMRRVNKNVKAFTLIETMVGIVIIITAIMGPLSAAISSASYAKDTKDKITAIYLAQEAIDILRFERDSILIKCSQNDINCILQDLGLGDGSFETISNASWRMFKQNLDRNPSSCFVNVTFFTPNANTNGCSFDFYGFTQNPILPTKYSSTDTSCNYLYRDSTGGSTGGAYLCRASNSLFSDSNKTKFSRVIKLNSISSIGASNTYLQKYNDDIRISVTVSYAKSSGFTAKTIEVIDFLHTKI